MLSIPTPEEIPWSKSEISHALRVQQALSVAEKVWKVGTVTGWDTTSGGVVITVASAPHLQHQRLLGFARHVSLLLESKVLVERVGGGSTEAAIPASSSLSFGVAQTLDHPDRGRLLEDQQFIHEAATNIWRSVMTPDILSNSEKATSELHSLLKDHLPTDWRAHLLEAPEHLTLRIETTLDQLASSAWEAFLERLSERKEGFPVKVIFSQSHNTLIQETTKLLPLGTSPYRCEISDSSRTVSLLGSQLTLPESEALLGYHGRTGYELSVKSVPMLSPLEQRAKEQGAIFGSLPMNRERAISLQDLTGRLHERFGRAAVIPIVTAEDNHLYLEFPVELPRSYLEKIVRELQNSSTDFPCSVSVFCSPPGERRILPLQQLPLMIRQLTASEEWSTEVQTGPNSLTILFRTLSEETSTKASLHCQELVEHLCQLYPELSITAERDLGLQFHYDVVLQACRELKFAGKFDVGVPLSPDAPVPLQVEDSKQELAELENRLKALTTHCSFILEQPSVEHQMRISLRKICPRTPNSYEEMRTLANSLLESVPPNLSFSSCRLRGNTLLLTTDLTQFPDTIYRRLEETFATVPAHIEIQHGTRRLDEKMGDRERISMMIGMSIPNDIGLAGVRIQQDDITIRLSYPPSSSLSIDQWAQQLRNCITQPVEIVFDPAAHEELLPLLQQTTGDSLTEQQLVDFKKSRFPEAPKFRRQTNGQPRGYLDRTGDRNLKILVIDPYRTQVRESGLSARVLDDGRTEVGHHIIDRTVLVPINSTQERFALERPFALRGERSSRFPFSRPSLLEQGTLKSRIPSCVISTYCVVDAFGNYESTRVVLEKVIPNRTMAFRQIRPSLERGDQAGMHPTLVLLHQVHQALTENRRRDGIFSGEQTDVAQHLVEFFSIFLNERTTKWCQNQNSGIPLIYRVGQTPDAETRKKIIEGVARLLRRPPPSFAPHDEAAYQYFLQEASDMTSPGQIERVIATNTRRGSFTAEQEAIQGIQHGLARFSGQWRKLDAFVNQANLVAHILGKPFPFAKDQLAAMSDRFNAQKSSEQVARELQLLNQLDGLLAHVEKIGQRVPALLLSEKIGNGDTPYSKVFIPSLGRTADIPQLNKKVDSERGQAQRPRNAYSIVFVEPTADDGTPFRMGS